MGGRSENGSRWEGRRIGERETGSEREGGGARKVWEGRVRKALGKGGRAGEGRL